MLPTQAGRALVPPIHAEVLMRLHHGRSQSRSSPAADLPAAERLFRPLLIGPEPSLCSKTLLLRGNQEAGQDRRPAQAAARSEAHQVFRRLASSVPGPVQTADRPTL